MSLLDLLGQPFMVRGFVAALFVGVAAPAIGTYIVQRRLALMGDGLGHVSVTGVALGLVTHTAPTWTAVAVAILGAVLIEVIRERGNTGGDIALALLFYGGLAGGVFLTGLAGIGAARLQEFLFGSILSLSPADLVISVALSLAVVAISLGLSPQLFAISQDPDHARVAGIPVRLYSVLIAVLAAVSVSVAMRTVGLLLVSALMVIPVATVQQLTRSFRTTILWSMAAGVLASVGGLFLAAWTSMLGANVQPGPTIVLLALAGFIAIWPIGSLLLHRKRRTAGPDSDPVLQEAHHEH